MLTWLLVLGVQKKSPFNPDGPGWFECISTPAMPWRLLQGGRFKYVLVAVFLCLVLVFQMVSSSQRTLGIHSQTPVQSRPHFLYRSRFRFKPDLDYEQQLSTALDQLAHKIASEGSGDPPDTIWQVYLARELTPAERGDDSIQLEQKNSEWKYQVRHSLQLSRPRNRSLFSLSSLSRVNGPKIS